jgi:hypothetical protein
MAMSLNDNLDFLVSGWLGFATKKTGIDERGKAVSSVSSGEGISGSPVMQASTILSLRS